jgi:hypothetical protein
VRIAKNFDELANDVYQTMAFVEMQDLSYSYNKETLLDNLDTIYSRTRNISKENSYCDGSRLYSQSKDDDTSIVVNILISGIDTVKWVDVADIKKITVYRILQEL